MVSEEGRFGSINECIKPMLALRIATAVFIKTYTYETFKEPLKVFPDLKNVALMVYEPETFAAENMQPSDIKTTLDEMLSRLPHFTSEGGRYWFTPFSLVIEHVEKRAEEMLRGPTLELYRTLSAHAREILLRKERRRERIIERGEIFDERNTTILGYGDYVWGEITVQDTPLMKLIVLVKPDVTEEKVRKLNQNWDLTEGAERREFRDIANVFYTVTTAPFTTRGAIEQAIQQGLESLSIGIKDEGVPYWKRIGPENGARKGFKVAYKTQAY